MKLTTMTQVTVDGVMQGPGEPEEDRGDGFECGGWAMPHFDSETAALVGQASRLEGRNDPGLPAGRAPAVRNGTADLKHVT